MQANSKKAIVFLINDLFVNTWISTYRELLNTGEFNPVVVALDSMETELSKKVDKKEVSKLLKSLNIPHQVDISLDEIAKIKPEFVFYLKPYDDYIREDLKSCKLKEISKLVHISYGAPLVEWNKDYAGLANNKWLDNSTAMFVESEKLLSISSKFVFSGYAKLDSINLHNYRTLSENQSKFVIAYKPRWIIGNSEKLFETLKIMSNLMSRNDLELKFIQHPMLERSIANSGDSALTKAFNSFTSSHGVKLVNSPNFLEEMLAADLLISDVSSAIPEFMSTGKPVIWTKFPWSENYELNILGESVAEHCSIVNTLEQLEEVLDSHISNGQIISKSQIDAFDRIFNSGNVPPYKRIVSVLKGLACIPLGMELADVAGSLSGVFGTLLTAI